MKLFGPNTKHQTTLPKNTKHQTPNTQHLTTPTFFQQIVENNYNRKQTKYMRKKAYLCKLKM